VPAPGEAHDTDGLKVEEYTTIAQVDRATWDGVLGSSAYIGWDAMSLAERVFDERQPKREHSWKFRYALVRNEKNEIVAAAPFTTAVMKDDAFMQEDVSRALEEERVTNPYYQTSLVVSMGSLLSEGRHMYLPPGPRRMAALGRLVGVAEKEMQRAGSSTLILRDLGTDDVELNTWLNSHGFIPMPLLDSHTVDIEWKTDEEYLEWLGSRRKRLHVQEQMDHEQFYHSEIWTQGKMLAPGEAEYLHSLYRNVASRNFRMNLFLFPENLIRAHLESPAWELLVVHLKPDADGPADGRPVAWGALHHFGDECRWLYCGIDYRYMGVKGRSAYRQMLLQIVRRARTLGRKRLHLGMGADLEKERFGSHRTPNTAYVRADDHFSGALMQEFVTKLALGAQRAKTGTG
jgi:predicted N-acyltransferase